MDVPLCLLNLANPDSAAVLADYQTKGATVYGEVMTGLQTSMPWGNSNLLMSSHQAGLYTDNVRISILFSQERIFALPLTSI